MRFLLPIAACFFFFFMCNIIGGQYPKATSPSFPGRFQIANIFQVGFCRFAPLCTRTVETCDIYKCHARAKDVQVMPFIIQRMLVGGSSVSVTTLVTYSGLEPPVVYSSTLQ